MNIKSTILIFGCLIFISCRQKQKSRDVMNQAMDIYLQPELDDNVKIDSSLILTNIALKFNDKNMNALNHKSILLFKRKDLEGLIEVVDKLLKLTDKPMFLSSKATFLEIQGKTVEAKECYSESIQIYEQNLKMDTSNFNLIIEYVEVLKASSDIIKANKILAELKKMKLEEYQLKMLDRCLIRTNYKTRFKQYWRGEIGYDQIKAK